jgi:RNA polymerase sigma-70 factor, ECF subfamily
MDEFFRFDDEYVRRLREGDPATEEHFYRYFRDLLTLKLRRRVPIHAVPDLVQETFIRVISRLKRDELREGGGKFGPFVNATCENVLREYYRKKKHDENPPDPGPGPQERPSQEDDLLREERQKAVRAVLDSLPERDAKILRAVFLEEKTKDEICAEFDVDGAYLRVLIHRAKEKFRQQFEL